MHRNKIFKILIAVVAFIFLVLIRGFEGVLFYDPFLDFFKQQNQINYPEVDFLKLVCSFLLRYFLNSFLSVIILWSLFLDYKLLRFSAYLFVAFFLVLIVCFSICLLCVDEDYKMILFYIRRFIIQPLFLFLFIPGFYFQKTASK